MCRFLLSLCLGLALISPVRSADQAGRFAVKGVGVQRCAQFMAAWEAKDKTLYAYGGWVEGFLSADNRYRKDTFDSAGWRNTNVLLALLAHHCKGHPDQPFVTAVRAMIQAMAPTRIEAETPLIEVRAKGKATLIYRETLLRLQRALKERGLYRGRIDGRFGKGTSKALEAYQKRAGIPVTGLPDQFTLMRLLSTPESGGKH